MKLTIILTDDNGRKYEGTVLLSQISDRRGSRMTLRRSARPNRLTLSFDQNPRAFMKRYANGLRGPQIFTLLLARLTKGDTAKEVTLVELEKHWNSMKALMDGPFNRAHSNRAKDSGWVDSPKRGIYVLASSWREALRLGND